MNITIITLAFPYPRRGSLFGIERSIENLSFNLKKLGHNVKIVTTYWNGGKKYDNYKGIPILRVLDSKARLGKIGSIFLLNHLTFGLNIIRKKHFKFYENSNIIILPLAIGFTFFFRIKKIPKITIFHHVDTPKKITEYLYIPIYHILARRQFKKSSKIIVRSKFSKKLILNYYKLKNKKIEVIPDGIDIKKFNPNNLDPSINQKYGKNILLYVGPFFKRKRISILLVAMPKILRNIPDVHLILIGEGEQLKYCKKLVYKLKIEKNVSFLGFVDDKDLVKYYASSNIFILPSENEGFGQVILEAMASKIPVVCSNILPMSELIKTGGLTFNLNDPIDLSRKVIELLKDKQKLEDMKENAYKLVNRYKWLDIAKLYIKFIKE